MAKLSWGKGVIIGTVLQMVQTVVKLWSLECGNGCGKGCGKGCDRHGHWKWQRLIKAVTVGSDWSVVKAVTVRGHWSG